MKFEFIKLIHNTDATLYKQLYQRFREAIETGNLQPGDRVPSIRSLASELSIARGTVELAYQMLTYEGYFLSRGPAGTVVSPLLNKVDKSNRTTESKSHVLPVIQSQTLEDVPCPFQFGLPALDSFPRKTWTRLACRNQRTFELAAMNYPDPTGYKPLRRAIASYLGISRGISCSYEQVFITPGYRGALELICRAVLQKGDSGWYEDPGYIYARNFLQRMEMHLIPIPVDSEGIDVTFGLKQAVGARFALVTPSHQCPMGVSLSLSRRLELLAWAKQQQSWIIEDDYDSEFRYLGRPLPALKSLDQDGRVLYTSTFSKVLFPGVRLGYVVVPESQIERFRDAANHLPGPGSIIPQATVAEFMEQGYFSRHLRKMRSLYAIRRNYLVDALHLTFGNELCIPAMAGGTHIVAMFSEQRNDNAWAAAAQSHGLAVQALSLWSINQTRPGLLMGFANVSDTAMAMTLVSRLQNANSDLIKSR